MHVQCCLGSILEQLSCCDDGIWILVSSVLNDNLRTPEELIYSRSRHILQNWQMHVVPMMAPQSYMRSQTVLHGSP